MIRPAFLIFGVVLLSPPISADEKKSTEVDSLIGQLKAADNATKLKALTALTELGPRAKEAVPHLAPLLEVKDENIRLNTALALSKIGEPAVKSLQEMLDHKDDDVRFYAVWSLGWIGPPAKEAAAQVVKMLADPSDNVRRKAAFSLGKIAPEPEAAIQALLGAFKDKNADVRQAAAEAIAQFKEAAVPALKDALAVKDAEMRVQVLKSLESIGPAATKALPEVQAIFLVGDKATAEAARNTLAKMGKDAIDAFKEGLKSERGDTRLFSIAGMGMIGAPAVPDLVDALSHSDVEVRRQAASQLGRSRVGDRMVVLGLAHAASDKDRTVVLATLQALQMLGGVAKEAAPKVLPLLTSTDKQVRSQAYSVLQTIRGDAKDVLPDLLKMLDRKDLERDTLSYALLILPNYGPDTVKTILRFVKHDDVFIRKQAVDGLTRVGGDLSPYLSELEALATDTNKDVRRSAVQGLGRAGEKAFKSLHKALKDEDPSIRSMAAASLKQLGSAAKPALDDLVHMAVKDANFGAKRNAMFALGGLEEDGAKALGKILSEAKDQQTLMFGMQTLSGMKESAAPAVDALIGLLKSPTPLIRWNAATALGNIGPAAKAAIPALQVATKDANPTVRNFATRALAMISPGDLK